MNNWIDSSITPSLLNTDVHCVLLMNNNSYHIGIYSMTDGWWDYSDKMEIIKENFQCYLPFYKPTKKVKTQTIVEWK